MFQSRDASHAWDLVYRLAIPTDSASPHTPQEPEQKEEMTEANKSQAHCLGQVYSERLYCCAFYSIQAEEKVAAPLPYGSSPFSKFHA